MTIKRSLDTTNTISNTEIESLSIFFTSRETSSIVSIKITTTSYTNKGSKSTNLTWLMEITKSTPIT